MTSSITASASAISIEFIFYSELDYKRATDTSLYKLFTQYLGLIEGMKSLHCPIPISINSFEVPNFQLVAKLLLWLVKQYDSGIELQDKIETENDRVAFLEAIGKVHSQLAIHYGI